MELSEGSESRCSLRGATRSAVYRDRPRTLNELKSAIPAYVRNISQADLQKEFANKINPYPTAFPYGNGMVLHFYQQQESSTTKTVHKVINRGLKTYV